MADSMSSVGVQPINTPSATRASMIFFTEAGEIADYRDFCSKVDRVKFRDFALRLMDKGIYMNPSATLHSLSSIAHTEADIAATAKAMAEVLDEMP